MKKKKISQNVRLLFSHGGIFLFAAAGVILFADLTGNLQTGPANQAGIACLQRADKIRRKQIRTLQKYKLLQAEFAHSTQAKEHKQCRVACGAWSTGIILTFFHVKD